MIRSAPRTTGSESRLVKVLDDYLAALQRGDAPARSELLAAHPDLADDLEACLASLEFIRQAEDVSGGARSLPTCPRVSSATSESSARRAAAAWGWCTRPNR